MGDIYLFKMLILLIKMHIYVLNQKNKETFLDFTVALFLSLRFGKQIRSAEVRECENAQVVE